MSGKIRIIGLTGNTGSGKTTAAEIFRESGFSVLDADAVSRSLLEPDGECLEPVLERFGRDLLLPDGTLDRKRLGGIVFSDPEERAALNAIVHPEVIRRMEDETRRILEADPEARVVQDVPLLFECGMDRGTDWNVFVYAPDRDRLERIMLRDGCSREAALERMNAQDGQREKMLKSDEVLYNDGTLEDLQRRTERLIRFLPLMERRIWKTR